MQMAADGPEKILRPLKLPQFAWREEANVDKFRHRTNAMHIFADPEQGMQIAKPPLPFLHIGLDDIAAVAHPFMPLLKSKEHTSDLQSLMRLSYAVFCLKTQTHITPLIHVYIYH